MQVTCEAVDASQLLRDILQSKEQYQAKILDNNNSTTSSNTSSRDIFTNGGDCNSEMISPLLHSKSSDMAYNDRDNDTEVDNDNDIDVTTENCVSGDDSDAEDQTDDQGDNSKMGGSDTSFTEGESKEARRAHVENILTSMKQSPRANNIETSTSITMSTTTAALKSHSGANGDIKRQKRKQPQPQQHDTAVLSSEDVRQMEYLQAAKRMRKEGTGVDTGTDLEDNADDEDDDDDDVENHLTDENAKCMGMPNGETKRARVEHILSAMRSPSHSDQDLANTSGLSPSIDGNKKQKRKQTQPQQHENNKSGPREFDMYRHPGGVRYDANKDDASSNSDDGSSDNNNVSAVRNSSPARSHPMVSQNIAATLTQDPLFSANLLRGLHDKEYPIPFQNGYDPHQIYRENLFRHGFLGLQHDIDPIAAAYRGMARGVHAFSESESSPRRQHPLSAADYSQITETLKTELNQVVCKTIDKVFSKVIGDKLHAISEASKEDQSENNAQNNSNTGNISKQHLQQQQHHQQQQQPPQHPAQSAQLKIQPSLIMPPQFSLNPRHQTPSTLQQPQQHHQEQQQQQQQTQQQTPSSQSSLQLSQPQPTQQHSSSHSTELEAHKENVNNSQIDKKPELIVPFSDHLHFLERYGNRHLQEKMNAFEPLHKPESDLITPHTGPSMPFHPPFPYYLPSQVLPPLYTGEPEQTEALPLIVNTPKKKRTKVTDTRLSSPRSKPSLLQDGSAGSSMESMEHQRHLSAFPHFMSPLLQTSVAITNPSFTPTDLLALRLREAAFGESRMPSPQEQSRSSPHSPVIDSPHYMSKMDMYERASLTLAGSEAMDPNSAHLISF